MLIVRGIIKLRQFCYLYPNVIIGYNVTVFPGAVIGRPPLSSGATKRRVNLKSLGTLEIGNNCVIGSNSVIYIGSKIHNNVMICDTACVREKVEIKEYSLIAQGVTINTNTKIGKNVKIMDNCHITGNCIIEDNVFVGMLTTMANDNNMGKGSKNIDEQIGPHIKNGVTIGQGSCILPNVIIGENSTIGANSVVTKSIPPFCLAKGIPARITKLGNVKEEK